MEPSNSQTKINWYRIPCDKDLLKELHEKNNLKALCQSSCYLLLIILTGFLSWFSFTYFGNVGLSMVLILKRDTKNNSGR